MLSRSCRSIYSHLFLTMPQRSSLIRGRICFILLRAPCKETVTGFRAAHYKPMSSWCLNVHTTEPTSRADNNIGDQFRFPCTRFGRIRISKPVPLRTLIVHPKWTWCKRTRQKTFAESRSISRHAFVERFRTIASSWMTSERMSENLNFTAKYVPFASMPT